MADMAEYLDVEALRGLLLRSAQHYVNPAQREGFMLALADATAPELAMLARRFGKMFHPAHKYRIDRILNRSGYRHLS